MVGDHATRHVERQSDQTPEKLQDCPNNNNKKLGKQWLRNYILRSPWHPLLGLRIRLSGDWRGLILDPQRGGGYEFRSLEVTKQGVLGGSVEVKGAH